VNCNDVRVGKATDGFGFFEKPFDKCLAGDLVLTQDLQGNSTVNLGIVGPIDHPHGTSTHFALDLIAAIVHEGSISITTQIMLSAQRLQSAPIVSPRY